MLPKKSWLAVQELWPPQKPQGKLNSEARIHGVYVRCVWGRFNLEMFFEYREEQPFTRSSKEYSIESINLN